MVVSIYPETPDGRYFVSRGRLWRKADPAKTRAELDAHIKALMAARRAVRDATDDEALNAARARVDVEKHALGERGDVWWTDGAPDESRLAPRNSSYAAWWDGLTDAERERGKR